MSAEAIEDTFVFAEPSRATTRSYRYLAGFEFGQKAVVTGRFLAGPARHPGRHRRKRGPQPGPAFQALILAPFLAALPARTPATTATSTTRRRAVVFEEQPTRNTYTYDRLHLTLELDLPLSFVGRLIAGWQSADYRAARTPSAGCPPRERTGSASSEAASCGASAATPASA